MERRGKTPSGSSARPGSSLDGEVEVTSQFINSYVDNLSLMMDNLISCTSLHLKHCQDSKVEMLEVKNDTEETLLELIRMKYLMEEGPKVTKDVYHKFIRKQMGNLKKEKDSLLSLTQVEELENHTTDLMKSKVESLGDDELKEHPKYAEWLDLFSSLNLEEKDSEEEEELESLPTTDPFTKRKLLDPVKNSICGHIYSLSTIIGLLNKKRKIKCPIPGCENKEIISTAYLVHDQSIKEKIRKIIDRESKRGSKKSN